MSADVGINISHVGKSVARTLSAESMYAKSFAMQGIALLVRKVAYIAVDVVE